MWSCWRTRQGQGDNEDDDVHQNLGQIVGCMQIIGEKEGVTKWRWDRRDRWCDKEAEKNHRCFAQLWAIRDQSHCGNHVECATELCLQSRGGEVAPAAKLDSNAHPTLTLWVFHGCSTSIKQVSLQK